METQFKTSTATLNANLAELPILKHFSQDEITTNINSFRKGEKGIFWFLKLAALVGVGYLTWVYVLPPIFQAIGQMLGLVATAAIIVASLVLAPTFVRWLRTLAKKMAKKMIKDDPFGKLGEWRQKMVENISTFRVSKGAISTLKGDMEAQAVISEKEVKEGQATILKLQAKAEKLKGQMEEMVKTQGPDAKGEDAYIDLVNQYQTTLAEGQRVANKLNQSTVFVSKYGTRANIMKKMLQKLSMVETQMGIKLADFDVTIEMLKKDYDFGQRSNAATSAAKSALGFTKDWEFDYALDVITSTISADIAITSGNLRDIDALTAGFSLDSDESFSNLNLIADRIKTGVDVVPTAKQYRNPEYKITAEDKVNSGGFTEIF